MFYTRPLQKWNTSLLLLLRIFFLKVHRHLTSRQPRRNACLHIKLAFREVTCCFPRTLGIFSNLPNPTITWDLGFQITIFVVACLFDFSFHEKIGICVGKGKKNGFDLYSFSSFPLSFKCGKLWDQWLTTVTLMWEPSGLLPEALFAIASLPLIFLLSSSSEYSLFYSGVATNKSEAILLNA